MIMLSCVLINYVAFLKYISFPFDPTYILSLLKIARLQVFAHVLHLFDSEWEVSIQGKV
jgi:hypothetical protein